MNLIPCDEKCRYKQDGYCALNHIARLTSGVETKCGYFEAIDSPVEGGKRLGNVGDRGDFDSFGTL